MFFENCFNKTSFYTQTVQRQKSVFDIQVPGFGLGGHLLLGGTVEYGATLAVIVTGRHAAGHV